MPSVVDLSHSLEPGMPTYPGIPPMRFDTILTHEQAGVRGTYAPGTTFQLSLYELGGNTGTYLDAPFHRHAGGADLASLPLDRCVNLPGVLVEGPGDGPLLASALDGLHVEGAAVLIRTGWDGRWGTDGYFRSGPFVTRGAAERLAEGGAALVGIDCANIDNMADLERPAHTLLLGAGIPVVEHLTGLDTLRGRTFRFFAAPPAIAGGTTFTVRAFAVID